jgi:hypothetical protein
MSLHLKRRSTPSHKKSPQVAITGRFVSEWRAPVGSSSVPSAQELEALGLFEARSVLVQELERAFEHPAAADKERIRYIVALSATTRFMQRLRVPLRLVDQLSELTMALCDLNDGIVAEFLSPAERHNRPGISSRIWERRAYLALAVDVLVQAGHSRRAACQYVASKSKSLDKLISVNAGTPASALATWYSNLTRGKVKNARAVSVFEDRANLIGMTVKWIGSDNPKDVARDLIAFAERSWASRQKPTS